MFRFYHPFLVTAYILCFFDDGKDVYIIKITKIYLCKSGSSHIDHLCSIIHVASKVSLLFDNYLSSAAGTHIGRLPKKQKRAAPIINNSDFNAPSEEMFNALGWFAEIQ